MNIKTKFTTLMTGLIIMAMACIPAEQVKADTLTDKEVIQSYYEDLNENNIEKVLSSLAGEYGEIAQNIYTDKENIANHIGIFNISSAEVLNIEEVSSFDGLDLLELSDYEDEIIKVYKVRVDITKYQEDNNEFYSGVNEIYFILNSNSKIIGCRMLYDMPEVKKSDNNISLLGYDTPISKPSANPDKIRVYRTNTGKIETVGFKKYCKVVTSCEVGMPNWDKAALRACAMAVKDFAIAHLYGRKYIGVGFDTKDNTEDQVYNPNKTRVTQCDDAVNFIWNYYVVDANSKLFATFHVKNVSSNSYAAKHKGVLSQEQAQSLAVNSNYSWKKILKYFYTRESGKAYYNSEVAVGSVSIVN